MTGAEFLNEIVGTTGNVLGEVYKSLNDADYRKLVLRWLNRVGKDIETRQKMWHWRFLEKTATFPTVASQVSYDLPSDLSVKNILNLYVRGSLDWKLRYISVEKFREYVADPSNDEGDPQFYTVFADGLRLWPVPSSVVTVYMDYVKNLTAMTDSTGTWEIPDQYDDIIIDGILSKAYRYEPQLGNRADQVALYEAGVKRMIDDNLMVRDQISTSRNHRGARGGAFPLADDNF